MSKILCGDKRLTDLSFRKGKYFVKTDTQEHIVKIPLLKGIRMFRLLLGVFLVGKIYFFFSDEYELVKTLFLAGEYLEIFSEHKIFLITAFVLLLVAAYLIVCILVLILSIFGFFLPEKEMPSPDDNESTPSGYEMDGDGEYVHRNIAEERLNRSLKHYEVVHHINGRPDDNSIENLCVMSRSKHEQFHGWLRWYKDKKGYYPRIPYQKKVLKNSYYGKFLD